MPLTAVTGKCRPNDTISFTQFNAVSRELQYTEIFTCSYRCCHIFLLVHATIHLEEISCFKWHINACSWDNVVKWTECHAFHQTVRSLVSCPIWQLGTVFATKLGVWSTKLSLPTPWRHTGEDEVSSTHSSPRHGRFIPGERAPCALWATEPGCMLLEMPSPVGVLTVSHCTIYVHLQRQMERLLDVACTELIKAGGRP